jgi:PTH1 family peptidyl-tRNA hydrolase
MKWLIAGLGNPGPRYLRTRHNIGFLFTDALVQHFALQAGPEKFSARSFHGEIDGISVRVIQPQAFMNCSGEAVGRWLAYEKVPLAQLLVVHDEVELALGKTRLKDGGGAAGHNGLRSISQTVGTEYMRLRLGVGRAEHGELSDYVLSPFRPEEYQALAAWFATLCQHFPLLLHGEHEAFIKHLVEK